MPNAHEDINHFIEFVGKLAEYVGDAKVDISVRSQKGKIIFGVSKDGKCIRRVFVNKGIILQELEDAYLELADKL